jgi:hypothetical protein
LMIGIGEHPPEPISYTPAPYRDRSAIWDGAPSSNRLYANGAQLARQEDAAVTCDKGRWGKRWSGKGY